MIIPATAKNILKVAAHLCTGGIAAFATETVYGLGADATNDSAVAAVYDCKQRPKFNPLIAHYAELNELSYDVKLNPNAELLAEHFWPGPLTLVLPKTTHSRIGALASAGLSTAAVRMPAHHVARQLLQAAARPIVAPSANPSGRLSPVSAEQVYYMLQNKVPYILDGGLAQEGLESTIVDLTSPIPTILRLGTITLALLQQILPNVKMANLNNTKTPKAPGMLLAHYAPRCGLRLTIDNPIAGEALLTFGDSPVPKGFTQVMNLSKAGDFKEAACNLFTYLHIMEKSGASRIAAPLLPEESLGQAINDRLRRASAN